MAVLPVQPHRCDCSVASLRDHASLWGKQRECRCSPDHAWAPSTHQRPAQAALGRCTGLWARRWCQRVAQKRRRRSCERPTRCGSPCSCGSAAEEPARADSAAGGRLRSRARGADGCPGWACDAGRQLLVPPARMTTRKREAAERELLPSYDPQLLLRAARGTSREHAPPPPPSRVVALRHCLVLSGPFACAPAFAAWRATEREGEHAVPEAGVARRPPLRGGSRRGGPRRRARRAGGQQRTRGRSGIHSRSLG